MSLAAEILALASSLGTAFLGINKKIDALGGLPITGPGDWAAYTQSVTKEGSSLRAGPGAYPGVAFALLGRKIAPQKTGALEINFSRGCRLSFSPSAALGDPPEAHRRVFYSHNAGYGIFDRGIWINPPFQWQAGDRIQALREGSSLKISLKPLGENTWNLIHEFYYSEAADIYFHASFYVEPPSLTAEFSNPFCFQMNSI